MNEQNKSQSPYANGALDPEKINLMVRERAYLKAEKRGFLPGHELDDWLEAENEIENQCRYWRQEID